MKHHGNIKSKGDAKGLLHLTNCDELCSHVQIINQVRSGVATSGPYGLRPPLGSGKFVTVSTLGYVWSIRSHSQSSCYEKQSPLAAPWAFGHPLAWSARLSNHLASPSPLAPQ